jgi:hypothetical protein
LQHKQEGETRPKPVIKLMGFLHFYNREISMSQFNEGDVVVFDKTQQYYEDSSDELMIYKQVGPKGEEGSMVDMGGMWTIVETHSIRKASEEEKEAGKRL